MKLALNPEIGLFEKDGIAFCDSLQVAETFEKAHSEILKSIEGETRKEKHTKGLTDELNRSSVNTRDYFNKVKYKDSQNKTQPKYLMSKDGFVLLAMGLTGEKALRFKLAYIEKFNRMEEFIKTLLSTKIEFPAFTDAIMDAHEEPKHYHFSNEINMLYRIVLGCDAKQFRLDKGIENGAVIKPYLSTQEIKAIELLQRVDIGLIAANLNFEQRKAVLANKHQRGLLKLVV